MKTRNVLRAALLVPRIVRAVERARMSRMERAAGWVRGRLPVRRRRSRTPLVLGGLGAAAVALPLGVWVGRRVRGRTETAEAGTSGR
jgi:hypothetical protein